MITVLYVDDEPGLLELEKYSLNGMARSASRPLNPDLQPSASSRE